MRLNINDEHEFEAPIAPELERQLERLEPEQFAVLSSDDEVYIQCYLNDDGYFDLEYRAGSFEEHYRIESAEASVVIAGFTSFHAKSFESWKSTLKWEKADFDEDFQGDEFLTHWTLNGGEDFPRIRVGKEAAARQGNCKMCASEPGTYHAEDCDLEECPRCHGVLVRCDCDEDTPS